MTGQLASKTRQVSPNGRIFRHVVIKMLANRFVNPPKFFGNGERISGCGVDFRPARRSDGRGKCRRDFCCRRRQADGRSGGVFETNGEFRQAGGPTTTQPRQSGSRLDAGALRGVRQVRGRGVAHHDRASSFTQCATGIPNSRSIRTASGREGVRLPLARSLAYPLLRFSRSRSAWAVRVGGLVSDLSISRGSHNANSRATGKFAVCVTTRARPICRVRT